MAKLLTSFNGIPFLNAAVEDIGKKVDEILSASENSEVDLRLYGPAVVAALAVRLGVTPDEVTKKLTDRRKNKSK